MAWVDVARVARARQPLDVARAGARTPVGVARARAVPVKGKGTDAVLSVGTRTAYVADSSTR